jgi:tetratricopeptide (TPR) repeat protein
MQSGGSPRESHRITAARAAARALILRPAELHSGIAASASRAERIRATASRRYTCRSVGHARFSLMSTDPHRDSTELSDSTPPLVQPDQLAPGTRLGRYRILALVGEGGMGRVYRAEQLEPVQRTVALKLIRGASQDPLLSAMLAVEAQALAQVDHPAIARLYEVGRTLHGEPFLALEWVEGEDLDAYLARTDPPAAARVRLLQRICLGVHHAHLRGVVHRDIKPGNILVPLVDGRPEPKLIDFGIAVAGGPGPGMQVPVAGSRGYMAPEQARGDSAPDLRSDVYSLGMTLLAAFAPGADAARDSLRLETLRELLAQSTSRLQHGGAQRATAAALAGVPYGLRAILRMALAESPADRYASALDLADDLDAFLSHRPLRALPHTRRYLLGRFARRHRLALAVGSAVLLAVLAGSGLALYGLVQARAAQQLAEESAAQARREAARSATLAGFLRDVLGGITPDEARGQDTTLLQRIFDRAQRRAEEQLADDPALLLEATAQIGANLRLIGKSDASAQALQAVLARVEGTPLAHATAAIQARRALAVALYELDQDPKAREAAERALADTLAHHGADLAMRVGALSDLGWVQQIMDPAAALERMQEAHALAQSALDRRDPLRVEVGLLLATVYLRAADAERAQPLFDEAIPLLIERFGADHPRVHRARSEAAIVLLRRREFATAEPLLRELLAQAETLYGANHAATLALVNNLGSALRQQGKVEEAAPYYERGYQAQLALHGAQHTSTLIAFNNLARLRVDQGRASEILAELRQNVADGERALGSDTRVPGEFRQTLARALAATGRSDEALAVWESAWQFTVQHQGTESGDARELVGDVLDHARKSGREDLAAGWRERPH